MLHKQHPCTVDEYHHNTDSRVFFLPPANEVWGKVIFLHLSVILFTGGGVPGQVLPPGQVHPSGQVHPPALIHPLAGTPPWVGTPPWAGRPPGQVHPLGRYTPGQVHPRQCMLGYGQQAGGTYPTGMHSCSCILLARRLQSFEFGQKTSSNTIPLVTNSTE